MLKILKPGFNSMWMVNFWMFKLDVEKSEWEIKLPTYMDTENTKEFQKNIYFCFIDYAKAFDCVHHNRLWKILKELETPHYLTCLRGNIYAGQEAQLEMDVEQHTGSR